MIDEIEAAFEMSRAVHEKRIKRSQAIRHLASKNINEGSAAVFIDGFRKLRRGELYKMALSNDAVELFLKRTHEARDAQGLRLALVAFHGNIDYYESVEAKRKGARPTLHSARALHARYDAIAAVLEATLVAETERKSSLATLESDFERNVRKSLRDSAETREARLRAAAKKPAKVKISIEAFVRNPDVVAAVLIRAGGRCEKCGNLAPFRRRVDGSPFLEVHHIQRLADGGEDSIDNAEALCPNCHRRAHYG
ncbi:HNH endonuclease [Caballeronia pedi]|uniref:HNH endonuclease n=1 Tax=Caballeronia pedi TaxID=1777141 RepID=A0A158DGB3_9BURK|nr:HNH endonuclease signature motif containing protein [Caballeronia pedi]SAK92857.1 HNH endonuclease [Caballeronia pedi]